jgi:hypothetical protein
MMECDTFREGWKSRVLSNPRYRDIFVSAEYQHHRCDIVLQFRHSNLSAIVAVPVSASRGRHSLEFVILAQAGTALRLACHCLAWPAERLLVAAPPPEVAPVNFHTAPVKCISLLLWFLLLHKFCVIINCRVMPFTESVRFQATRS